MSGARLHTLLPELTTRQSVMVVGAAVIDVIADAYAPTGVGAISNWKQQSVNVGGCALNIAVALKAPRHRSVVMPCRSVRACGRRLFATGWQKRA
ncbi:hypothetical protein ACP0HM_10250 [Escherichia coli]